MPEIRVSHIIKGRIPEAIHKPANQLLESDKTIYYERMMLCIEVPTIYETVEGNKLNSDRWRCSCLQSHESLLQKVSGEIQNLCGLQKPRVLQSLRFI